MNETVMPAQVIAPFPVDSPLLEPGDSSGSGISWPFVQWFQSLANVANVSAQINQVIPASATSPGSPGTIAYDGTYLYVCIAQDQWLRAPLSTF